MRTGSLPVIVVATAVALGLAGCGGSDAEPSPTPSAASAPPSASPSEAPPSAQPTVPTSTASAAPEGACSIDDLAVTQRTGDAGAGSVTVTFAFEDVGDGPCTLAGFPGVSAVGGGDGEQIGQPATRSDAAFGTVDLAPGGIATASMRTVDVGSGGGPFGDDCQAASADGWRVYPPGSTEAVLVRVDGLTACAGDVDWITVDPVVG